MYSATVGLVKATWHAEAVDAFAISCCSELKNAKRQIQVNSYNVPGVVEIPLFTKKLIQSQTVDIVVVAGLIADHGVYRHDFVAGTVVDALVRVGLETDTPVLSVVLTPHQYQETATHDAFFRDHFRIKGAEAAEACLAVIEPVVAETMAA